MNEVLEYMLTLRAEGYRVEINNGYSDNDTLVYLRVLHRTFFVARTVSMREVAQSRTNLLLEELKDMRNSIEAKKLNVVNYLIEKEQANEVRS